MSKRAAANEALDRIIRPIVEGQIRGFIAEHPNILIGVDWYKTPDRDRAKTLCGSLTKRIVRDLTCGSTSARLEAALLALESGALPISTVVSGPAAKRSWLEPLLAKIGRA